MFLGENNERKLNRIKEQEKEREKKQNQPNIFTVDGDKQDSDEDLEDLDEEQIIQIFKEENMLKKGPDELR